MTLEVQFDWLDRAACGPTRRSLEKLTCYRKTKVLSKNHINVMKTNAERAMTAAPNTFSGNRPHRKRRIINEDRFQSHQRLLVELECQKGF